MWAGDGENRADADLAGAGPGQRVSVCRPAVGPAWPWRLSSRAEQDAQPVPQPRLFSADRLLTCRLQPLEAPPPLLPTFLCAVPVISRTPGHPLFISRLCGPSAPGRVSFPGLLGEQATAGVETSDRSHGASKPEVWPRSFRRRWGRLLPAPLASGGTRRPLACGRVPPFSVSVALWLSPPWVCVSCYKDTGHAG